MKIGIVGLGLGYSLAQYLAFRAHNIVGVDIRTNSYLKPQLDPEMAAWMLRHSKDIKQPYFTDDYSALIDCELIMIFVSTPLVNGRLLMSNVLNAVAAASKVNVDAEYALLSTIPVGGMQVIHDQFPDVQIRYTPPMVKRHRFLSTFINPPSHWQLFGGYPSKELKDLYRSIQSPRVQQFEVSESVAEKAKLLTNLMLATKIIIANSIGEWAGSEGKRVCRIVNADPRVGKGYFTPGGQAAGPCLPRDLTELEAVTEGSLKEIVVLLNRINGTAKLI